MSALLTRLGQLVGLGGLLARIALRNLLASRLKTVIVGGIILLGGGLVVSGTALLDSILRGMEHSIVGSLAGHLQVYSSRSVEELALYGGMMGDTDIAPFEDFSRVKQALLKVPHVRQVVPMGIGEAFGSTGNILDRSLEKLRDAVRRRQDAVAAGQPDPTLDEVIRTQQAHVRRIVELMRRDLEQVNRIRQATPADLADAADLVRAGTEEFWAGFAADPLAALEFLENRIAPQALDGDMLYIRYVGTDLDAFQHAFDRLEVVQGTPVPRGQRGILLGSYYYEEWCKLKTARRLDRIREAREVNGKRIARDEQLQRWVKENQAQILEITQQLDPTRAQQAADRLRQALRSSEPELPRLLEQLLATDDANFDEHYRIFYAELAPLLDLYLVRIGDDIVIKAFTKAGYLKSVRVKVYGIFQFKGLEKSTFAGMLSLMDLMSFRDLYGYLTADRIAEIRQLKAAAPARIIARERAEAELFGGGAPAAEAPAAAPTVIDELAVLERGAGRDGQPADQAFTQAELEQGVALNVAVWLDDPRHTPETLRAIEAQGAREGLPLRAVDWQQAAGLVGQIITMARLVLFTAVLIIFIIAIVIINNAMVMATLQRVTEIGTMRAIGAQRGFILVMLLIEALVVGVLFGTLGAGLGAAFIGLLHLVGIPAFNEALYFFFSGPALQPTLTWSNVLLSGGIVLVVSVVSSFYPAWLAMRITPLEAMQSEE